MEKQRAEVSKLMETLGYLGTISPFQQLHYDLILERNDNLATQKKQKEFENPLQEALVRDGGEMRDKALGSMSVRAPRSARRTRNIQQFDGSSSARGTGDQEQSN